MNATKAKARKIAKTLAPLVADLLAMKVIAEVEREKMNALYTNILAADVYAKHDGTRITEPKRDWLMTDDDAARYYPACEAAIKAAGYKVPAGECPALVAETKMIEAEWALIKAAEPFFGLTNNALLCGTKDKGGMETRKEYLDLLIGLCLSV